METYTNKGRVTEPTKITFVDPNTKLEEVPNYELYRYVLKNPEGKWYLQMEEQSPRVTAYKPRIEAYEDYFGFTKFKSVNRRKATVFTKQEAEYIKNGFNDCQIDGFYPDQCVELYKLDEDKVKVKNLSCCVPYYQPEPVVTFYPPQRPLKLNTIDEFNTIYKQLRNPKVTEMWVNVDKFDVTPTVRGDQLELVKATALVGDRLKFLIDDVDKSVSSSIEYDAQFADKDN